MKNHRKILYIIEKPPDSIRNIKIIDKIREDKVQINPATVYIRNEGILWLHNEYWKMIFNPNENVVYYVNAQDAKDYSVPFQEGVIFSNPKIFQQLIKWADQVFFIN